MRNFDVAVVGATGAVGEKMLSTLSDRKFPVSSVTALASTRSVGTKVKYGNEQLEVQDLAKFDFSNTDIALFSAGGSISGEYAPKAARAGCVVIDNTSHFRQDPDVPLIIPEVNPESIEQYKVRNIIANPNCSTIQMLMALKPIHDFTPIERIVVSTYQAVSGTGNKAIDELRIQSQQVLRGEDTQPEIYPMQIAFNALPHIDDFVDNDYTKEEMKMHNETRKILGSNDIWVNATAVRIPVFYGHSESIMIETKESLTAKKARELIGAFPGVQVIDDPKNIQYPTAVTDAAGKDIVSVGRIRTDISNPKGLCLWVVGDNLLKGAALNSVQIAELLVDSGFLGNPYKNDS